MQALWHTVPLTLEQDNSDPYLHWRLLDTHRQVWVSLCGVTSPFSWVLVSTGFICAFQESISPVLCKFWRLYGGVNGNLLQEGLCHTQVYCTQSPCPCGSPLLTCTSSGDTHSSVSVSVGSLGPAVHKVCLSPLSISGKYGV